MILLSFFLSGAAGLVYEVLWVRWAALFSGHTAVAASAVLAAFMAGLGLGGAAGGRLADRLPHGRLLKLYAALELGIAAAGLVSKPLIHAAGPWLLAVGALDWPAGLQSAAYFSVAFAILLLPATLMGATLPVLVRWAAFHRSAAGREEPLPDRPLSLLYGVNILGGVAGTTAAGFLLIPSLGMTRALACAAAANVSCALIALARAARDPRRESLAVATPQRSFGVEREALDLRSVVILFITGAAAMACEVAWTRAFALLLGSTVYAFTVMLATFLAGLAAGSLAFYRWRERLNPGFGGLAALLALLGASVWAGLPLLDRLPYALVRLYPAVALSADLLFLIQFALCACVMIVPACLMGAVFPWVLAALRPGLGAIGSRAGGCYAANTAGAIAGSTLAGLLLVPELGVERTLVAAAWAYGAAALLAGRAAALKAPARRLAFAGVPAAMLLAAAFQPVWTPRLASSGMFLYAPFYADVPGYQDFLREMARDKVVFHENGRNATVSVLETPSRERYLRINGKTDASEGGDLQTQLQLGALPLFLHPGRPASALVVGLGSGVTAGALASDPGFERIDAVEIEPAVAKAAALFERSNRGVLKDPRLRLVVADARQFLAADGPRYDLITSEPSNPWISGIASLFTREYFELARSRLKENGVYCQWFHSYFTTEEDFRMVLATFASVFPHVQLFYNGEADFFLMGSLTPWRIDLDRARAAFRENGALREDLARAGRGLDHPFVFFVTTLVLTDAELRRYAADAPLHLDDRPVLEFNGPRNFHKKNAGGILESLTAMRASALPDGLPLSAVQASDWAALYASMAERFLDGGELDHAEASARTALAKDPLSPRAWAALGGVHAARGRDGEALKALRRATDLKPPDWRAWARLGDLYAKKGRTGEARRALRRALKLMPAEPGASLGLARLLLEEDPGEARRLAEAALSRPVPDSDLRRELAKLLD